VLSVCLINPRFEPSYWGFEYALPLYPGDRRSTMINGALPTVAALAGGHDLVVIDENVEEIDWSALDRFDVIGVTGMNVQRERQRGSPSGCAESTRSWWWRSVRLGEGGCVRRCVTRCSSARPTRRGRSSSTTSPRAAR
jgi:hypothetical protein